MVEGSKQSAPGYVPGALLYRMLNVLFYIEAERQLAVEHFAGILASADAGKVDDAGASEHRLQITVIINRQVKFRGVLVWDRGVTDFYGRYVPISTF